MTRETIGYILLILFVGTVVVGAVRWRRAIRRERIRRWGYPHSPREMARRRAMRIREE